MANSSWVLDLDSKITSLLRARAKSKLKKYGDVKFTTSDKPVGSKVTLPCVYVQTLSSPEMNKSLNSKNISSVRYSIQIDIYTDTSEMDAKAISGVVMDLLSEMHFDVSQIPISSNSDTIYRKTMRASRIIGNLDIL